MSKKLNKPRPSTADWYHTDSQGRYIGWMWPDDFKRDIDSIWGNRKGIAGFARYSGYNRTTVEKFCNGSVPIPKHVALLSQFMLLQVHRWRDDRNQSAQNKMRDFPVLKAPWLPGEEKKTIAGLPFG